MALLIHNMQPITKILCGTLFMSCMQYGYVGLNYSDGNSLGGSATVTAVAEKDYSAMGTCKVVSIADEYKRVAVLVDGMTYADYSGEPNKALAALGGVTVRTVYQKSGKVMVDVAKGEITSAAVVRVIVDTDYKVS